VQRIENWVLMAIHGDGALYRDALETAVEPNGVCFWGQIYNSSLMGMGLPEFDNGALWRTGKLIEMQTLNIVRCEEGFYRLGHPSKGYMPLYSESWIKKALYQDFGIISESMPDDTSSPFLPEADLEAFKRYAKEMEIPKFGFEMESNDENEWKD